jgi:hypothetical protein
LSRDWKPGDPLDDWSGEDIEAILAETSGPIPFPSRNVATEAEPPATQEPAVLPPSRWLADMDPVTPGAMLADGLMVPEGVTVLYGPGDVGKGHVACEAIRHLSAVGPVLILDYETHPSEWRRRLGMMVPRKQLARVAYMVPELQLPKEAATVRDEVARIGAIAVVLDSYQAATPDGRVHNEQADVPREMFRALARVGVPALVLAHVTKSGGEHPPYPYGSVFVHNYARMTWSAGKLSQEDEPLRVELRCRKSNDRTPELPRLYQFDYKGDKLTVTREMMLTRGEALHRVLMDSNVPMSAAAVYAALEFRGMLWEGASVSTIGNLLSHDRKGRFARGVNGWVGVKVG